MLPAEDCNLPAEDCNPHVSYYEMAMDDFKEHLINDCYVVMQYNKNDAIDYDNDDHNNITTQ